MQVLPLLFKKTKHVIKSNRVTFNAIGDRPVPRLQVATVQANGVNSVRGQV